MFSVLFFVVTISQFWLKDLNSQIQCVTIVSETSVMFCFICCCNYFIVLVKRSKQLDIVCNGTFRNISNVLCFICCGNYFIVLVKDLNSQIQCVTILSETSVMFSVLFFVVTISQFQLKDLNSQIQCVTILSETSVMFSVLFVVVTVSQFQLKI